MLKVSSRLKYLEYSIIFLSVTFVVSLLGFFGLGSGETERGLLCDPVRSPWSDWMKLRLGAEQPILNYRIPGADGGLYNQGCAVTEGIN